MQYWAQDASPQAFTGPHFDRFIGCDWVMQAGAGRLACRFGQGMLRSVPGLSKNLALAFPARNHGTPDIPVAASTALLEEDRTPRGQKSCLR